uniref:Secreted protein n=1 Tax=Oryza barthii TaxID=65489 RepID=A0A0D3GI73_9ORYZ
MTVVRFCSPHLLLLLLLVVTASSLIVLPAAASTGKSGKSGKTNNKPVGDPHTATPYVPYPRSVATHVLRRRKPGCLRFTEISRPDHPYSSHGDP